MIAIHALPVRRIFVHAFQQVFRWTVGNVFVKTRSGLLLREEKFAISVRKLKRHMAEEKHFAALQLVAMPGSSLQIVIGYVQDGRTAGYIHHKHPSVIVCRNHRLQKSYAVHSCSAK